MKIEDWGIIEYSLAVLDDARKNEIAKAFDEIYANGSHLIVCLEAKETEMFDRSIRTISNGGNGWRLHKFLTSPCVIENLAELEIPDLTEPPEHYVLGSYAFEGELTDTLIAGGCYNRWNDTEEKAREITRNFVEMVAENHRESLLTFKILGNWTSWFDELGYDKTLISCNLATRKLWFICTTDYD